MKKIIFLTAVLFATVSVAQKVKNETKWAIGAGVNFIDNTNSQNNNYLDVSNWNSTLSFSKLSVQYFYSSKLSVSSEFTINKLDKRKSQNGGEINVNRAYFGIDINARYNIASYIKFPNKFSLAPVVGLGNSWTDAIPNQSLNTGLAIGYKFNDTYGIRLQTLGKFAKDKNTVGNNMIQHALELYFNL